MMTAIIGSLQLVACLTVLVNGIYTINRMSSSTSHMIRYAYVAMTAGAAYGVLTAHQPTVSGMLIATGVAMFLIGDRRYAFC